MLTLDERKSILEKQISILSQRGYSVTSRTDTTATLVKPKEFSFVWAVLWFLVFGIGILIYIFYYMSKKDGYYEIIDEENTMTGYVISIKANVKGKFDATKIAKRVANLYCTEANPNVRIVVYDLNNNMIGILGKLYSNNSYFGGLRDYVR